MRLKILMIAVMLVSVLFLLGCVQEGVKVVRLQEINESSNSSAEAAPTQAETAQEPAAVKNETNVVQGTETGADLNISNFFVSTMYPIPGEDFEITFKIANEGSEPIKDFEYSIKFMQGNDIRKVQYYSYNSTLKGDSSTDKITKIFSLDEGVYDFVLTLDPSNAFIEPDELDNIIRKSMSAQYPVTSNGSSVQSNPGMTSLPSSGDSSDSTETTCSDTDGGIDYETKGTCTDDFGNNIDDICIDVNKLWEWRCSSNRCVYESKTCYCEDGRCID